MTKKVDSNLEISIYIYYVYLPTIESGVQIIFQTILKGMAKWYIINLELFGEYVLQTEYFVVEKYLGYRISQRIILWAQSCRKKRYYQ